MLKCREIVQKADDYLEGRLSTRQKLGFRMHLWMCKYCNRYVKYLSSTISVLNQSQKAPSATDEEVDRIYHQIVNHKQSSNKKS